MNTGAAMAVFLSVVLYAVFAGADFGAGFWDLTAGGALPGRERRALIEHSIGPVWEANHVWLIFCLVLLWSAFPTAFAAIMTALYVPLGLAALGIVLRGSGFAFRKVAVGTGAQRGSGVAFAASSVLTPFFFGAVAGGIASGRVPVAPGGGPVSGWVNPTSMLGGTLAVVTCAYLAAVFLTAEARGRGLTELEGWFRRRALASAAVAGTVAIVGVVILRADSPRLFHHLLGPAVPFLASSAAAGLAALLVLDRAAPRAPRLFAAAAVSAVVVGWGVAQYPYLLGTHLSISEAAAPVATLRALLVIFGAAVLVCGPALGLLYVLQQRSRLDDTAEAK